MLKNPDYNWIRLIIMLNILKNQFYRKLYFDHYQISISYLLILMSIYILLTIFLNAYYIHQNNLIFASSAFFIFNGICFSFFLFIVRNALYEKYTYQKVKERIQHDAEIDNSVLIRFIEEPLGFSQEFLCSKDFFEIIDQNIDSINHQNKEHDSFLHKLLKKYDCTDPEIEALVMHILQHDIVDIFICDAKNHPVHYYMRGGLEAFVNKKILSTTISANSSVKISNKPRL